MAGLNPGHPEEVVVGVGRRRRRASPVTSAAARRRAAWPPRTWCSTSARSTRPRTACCGCGSTLDGERIVELRADRRLHAPRRREAVRGPRLPADHRAGQPARLAVGVLQRARRGARGRADARHGGARAGGLDAHPARRAQPGAQPPDVPRLLPARARRDHADLLRVPRARDAPGRDGGGLRRPDALHVQPGRRPQGGPARPAGSAGSPRAVADGAAAGCPKLERPDLRQRDLPGPHPRRRRALPASWSTRTASVGPDRPGLPASTSTCAATSPTSPTTSCSATACCGS